MKIVNGIEGIVTNLKTFETYLKSTKVADRTFVHDLLKGGNTILMYKVGGKTHFAPARFCGYLNTTKRKYVTHANKNGLVADPMLDKILKGKARFLQKKEDAFLAYCATMELDVPSNKRTYWWVGTYSSPYMDISEEIK
jgi:hypothetical protein